MQVSSERKDCTEIKEMVQSLLKKQKNKLMALRPHNFIYSFQSQLND
jgi:transcription initiation factor TFIIIB Brf1 subunit/transcription initiation factor TFIIB